MSDEKENKPQIDVARICELAHLVIPAEEAEKFKRQLEKVLEYVRQLGELDLDGVEPTVYGHPVANAFREDIAVPWLSPDAAIANAPDRINGEFKVPKIVE